MMILPGPIQGGKLVMRHSTARSTVSERKDANYSNVLKLRHVVETDFRRQAVNEKKFSQFLQIIRFYKDFWKQTQALAIAKKYS